MASFKDHPGMARQLVLLPDKMTAMPPIKAKVVCREE
jgi:hypothetical protein